MNYTINQLIIFHKVVKTKSITKAAEELFMTQPAVSIQLKNFQDQFEIPLTELQGRQIVITDFGHEIFKITEKALDQLNELEYKTRDYIGKVVGKLKISSASTGKYVIPYFLSAFLEQYNGIDLVLDVTNKSKVIESLKNKEIDFAVVSVLPDDIEVEEEILMKNELHFISNLDYNDMARPLIYREAGSATRKEMEDYFKKGSKKRNRIELTSNEAVKQAVIAGLGNSILPIIGIKDELKKGSLNIIELDGLPITTEWRLIWLKNKKMTPVSQAYLEYIREEKASIQKKYF